MKNYKNIFILLLYSFFAISCNDLLDELPDNRTEIDSKDKIRKLLVSAYPTGNYALLTELSSDNIADLGDNNPNFDRIDEQMAYWNQVTETSNDDPKDVWEGCYSAIAHANQALDAIQVVGEGDLLAEKGEALITRAYGHFLLVTIFSQHFNEQTSGTDLGIPYLDKPETELNPKYERGTVKEVYEKINSDIEAALPLINDAIYTIPSYHFTKKAAYAFAARFNLFYQKWEKAKEYATIVLGANPENKLREWNELGNLPRRPTPVTNAYIQDVSNLLTIPFSSNLGVHFGAYYSGSRFNHPRDIANTETILAPTPWNAGSTIAGASFNFRPFIYSATNLDKTLFYKIPYLFEYTDPVARIGYRKTVMVPFNMDETLLVRAEANAMLKNYNEALNDINTWSKNFYTNKETTLADVNNFYTNMPYSTAVNPNQKKKLNPSFTVEAGDQENLIHYVLQCRRILTLHEGLRWFDIKRYGIEVPRFKYDATGGKTSQNTLTANDLRKAIQIPQDVISAGLTPNPR